MTFQYETDKVAGKEPKGQNISNISQIMANKIRLRSVGVIWERGKGKWWLSGGHCSFLSSWFSLWKCTFTPLTAAHRFNMTKVLLISYGFSQLMNKRARVCVRPKRHCAALFFFFSRKNTLLPFSWPCRSHFGWHSEWEWSRLTCNFPHSAKDVQMLWVHGSNTMVHIPVRHRHRRMPTCL